MRRTRKFVVMVIGLVIFSGGCSNTSGTLSDLADVPTTEGKSDMSGSLPTLNKIYVANEKSGTLSVIAEADDRVLSTLNLSEDHAGSMTLYAAHNVQAAPNGQSIWITAVPSGGHSGHGGAASEQVIIVDPQTDQITHRIEVGTELHLAHVVLDAASQFAYVSANEGNAVLKINAATYQIVGRFELGADHGPHGMRLCEGKVYIANMTAKNLSILDPATSSIAEVPLGGVAVQTACDPLGRYVFVSLYDTREVVRYDLATAALTRIALPEGSEGPVQLYPSPDGAKLYVCDQGTLMDRPASNKLYEIDTVANTVLATIEVGTGAHGVVVSEDGTRAFVTNLISNNVSVVDTTKRSVVATVSVGESPNGIAHWHVTGGMP